MGKVKETVDNYNLGIDSTISNLSISPPNLQRSTSGGNIFSISNGTTSTSNSNEFNFKDFESDLLMNTPMILEAEHPKADVVSRYISIFEKDMTNLPIIDVSSEDDSFVCRDGNVAAQQQLFNQLSSCTNNSNKMQSEFTSPIISSSPPTSPSSDLSSPMPSTCTNNNSTPFQLDQLEYPRIMLLPSQIKSQALTNHSTSPVNFEQNLFYTATNQPQQQPQSQLHQQLQQHQQQQAQQQTQLQQPIYTNNSTIVNNGNTNNAETTSTPSQVVFHQPVIGISSLTPLSSGGFIANRYATYDPNNPQPQTPVSATLFTPQNFNFIPQLQNQNFINTVRLVDPSIAVRQEKLERYRQKRCKRNSARVIDNSVNKRREKSLTIGQRPRNEKGHFVKEKNHVTLNSTPSSPSSSLMSDLDDVKLKLIRSEEESNCLKSRLEMMEREMLLLRQSAQQANVNHQMMMNELAQHVMINELVYNQNQQQNINKQLQEQQQQQQQLQQQAQQQVQQQQQAQQQAQQQQDQQVQQQQNIKQLQTSQIQQQQQQRQQQQKQPQQTQPQIIPTQSQPIPIPTSNTTSTSTTSFSAPSTSPMKPSIKWSTVPTNEVFSTVKNITSKSKLPTPSPFVNIKPYQQKIDFSKSVQDLIYTDSRHLEAARLEEEFVKRWEDMTFIAGN